MAISVLLYAGLALLVFGSLSLIHPPRFLGIPTRTRALVIAAGGFAAVVLTLVLPPPKRAETRGATRLDAFVPEFQFREFHERLVRAAPERIDRAIRTVPAEEIRLFRLFTWIRAPRSPWSQKQASILNPPAEEAILDVALRSGFVILAEDPGRELVLGTLVVRPRGAVVSVPDDPAETGRRFAALSAPGYAKAAMNFRIEPRPDGTCRLTTETRIFATDREAARRFAVYWRLIHPGSALLRVMWLRAIAQRAESGR
ncbi:MAG: hypothetical protein ACHQPI_13175 [Thermoanaerobaculia bacterium]